MKRIRQVLRGFSWMIFYLLILAYALAFTNKTGWALLILATIFVFIELLSLLSSIRHLEIESKASIVTHVNDTHQFTLTIGAKRFVFFPQLKVSLQETDSEKVLYLYRGQKQSFDFRWQAKQRKWVKEEVIIIESSDFLNLFKKRRLVKLNLDWIVLPEIHPLTASLNLYLKRMIEKQNSGEHSFNIKRYRSYLPGDSFKQIDWKLSSKKQELIYREYQHYDFAKQILIFYGCASEYFEETLSLFYSLHETSQLNLDFLMIGENIEDPNRIRLIDFALIQALHTSPELPSLKKAQILVLVPEYQVMLDPVIETLSASNEVLLLDYRTLLEHVGG